MTASALKANKTRQSTRKGNIVVLAAILMVVMLGCVAFAVDIGYLLLARTELQRSADSAALAATWDLIEQIPVSERMLRARITASNYAGRNRVCSSRPKVHANTANSPDGDIVLGTFLGKDRALSLADASQFNAVQVRIRSDGELNKKVPHFFAHVWGVRSTALEAEATAAVVTSIDGFRLSSTDDTNVPLLPITLHEDTWNDLVANTLSQDDFTFDSALDSVVVGGDGTAEAILFPQRNDSPGNFGTVNIGISANDTNHLSNQILNGISQADLDFHGGELKLGDNGTVALGGDTGISAGIKDELAAILGRPRIIPIYREVSGNGNNAAYTIVKFVGVRIMEVNLTGQNMRLVIQPANVVTSGAIPSETSGTSEFIFAPSRLVR